jgi:CBS domain-containing protein
MHSDRDLLLAESRAPLSLRRTIEDAGDIEAAGGRRASCARRSSRCTTPEPHRLESPRSSASSRDALTKRLNELTIAELGPPPCPFGWLALGSIGSREAAPSSDVDSGLVWDGESDAEERYMRKLGRHIVGELGAAGFVAVEQLRAGLEPDDYIDAEDLNPVTRSYVREAFHATSLVQRSLDGELAPPPP